MKYWILTSERSDEYELSIDGLPEAVSKYSLNFSQGEDVLLPADEILLPYTQAADERKTDNLVCAPKLGLVVNEKLKSVINEFAAETVQYAPLKLLNKETGDICKDYQIANVTVIYPCVDMEQSELELYDDGDIEFIDSLFLSLSPDTDYGHVFRIAEYSPLLVISSAFKTALEERKITGLRVYAPEEFSL
ncbi:MAG: hypothetical protein PF637_05710 [Spirochaetes bacterium]|jgi:hypothetical protein|nr:hypothetical protein [Spirochaetota bacterium]